MDKFEYFDYMERSNENWRDIMFYGKRLPDYYDTMYLDGYTPEEILEAVSRTMIKEAMAREREREAISSINIKSEVRVKK